MSLDCGYRLDMVVNDIAVVELKAIDRFAPIHSAQMLTYLKLTGYPVGLLINFNVPLLKDRYQATYSTRATGVEVPDARVAARRGGAGVLAVGLACRAVAEPKAATRRPVTAHERQPEARSSRTDPAPLLTLYLCGEPNVSVHSLTSKISLASTRPDVIPVTPPPPVTHLATELNHSYKVVGHRPLTSSPPNCQNTQSQHMADEESAPGTKEERSYMRFTARLFLTALFCLAMDAVTPGVPLRAGRRRDHIPFRYGYRYLGCNDPGRQRRREEQGDGDALDAASNESGYFSVPALNAGTYTVTVTLRASRPSSTTSRQRGRARGGQGRDRGRRHRREGRRAGGAEIIQTQSAAVSTTMTPSRSWSCRRQPQRARFVARCPASEHRRPGGSRDSTVNGLPRSAINITLDGMSVQDNHLKTTDGFFARVSPRLDAIEEVTVNSAAQDAASTGQGAVQIRFVTQSGSNNCKGSAY